MAGQRSQNVHQRIWRRFALVIIGVLIALYVAGPSLLEDVERNTFDMRQRALGVRPASGDVAVIAIDEKSLASVGRWPWSRSELARLVSKLQQYGANVIVLDMFFPEAENKQVLTELDRWALQDENLNAQWQQIRPVLDADGQLLKALHDHGRTILSLVFLPENEARHLTAGNKALSLQHAQAFAIQNISSTTGDIPQFRMPKMPALLLSLPSYNKAATAIGHITMIPDSDAVVRRAPLVLRYEDQFFPSADLYAAALFAGLKNMQLNLTDYGITGLSYGEKTIATDEQGRVIIGYHGPERTIPTFSAIDVMTQKITKNAFANKIVIVGATAQGIGDMRPTPWAESFPGVEIRANVIENLLHNEFISRPDWMAMLDIVALLLVGLLLFVLLPRFSMSIALSVLAMVLIAHIGATFLAYNHLHILLNITYPVLLGLSLFVAHTVVRYFTVEREKSQIKHAFRHYVSPKIVESVIDDVDSLKLGGDKREMTVLFSDIRDFTSTSEAVPPEQLVALLNGYLSEMTDKVFDYDGTLDKFIGDAVMAFWGAPVPRKDHALQSCKSAVAMFEALVPLQKHWLETGAGKLDIGIGINTGWMTVGNMGSNKMFNFTVIGDAVNLASRLEGLNKIYGSHLLICESTYDQVKDSFPNAREIDITTVKGKKQFVKVYELCMPQHYQTLDWLPEFRSAYDAMRREMWFEAMAGFSKIFDRTGDPVSRYHKEQLTLKLAKASDLTR